jgi:hypothetical protein
VFRALSFRADRTVMRSVTMIPLTPRRSVSSPIIVIVHFPSFTGARTIITILFKVVPPAHRNITKRDSKKWYRQKR